MLEPYIEELHSQGFINLRVKVHAKASQTQLKSILSDGTLKIDIASVPAAGRANEELIRYLAQSFNVSREAITITRGKFGSAKEINIKLA